MEPAPQVHIWSLFLQFGEVEEFFAAFIRDFFAHLYRAGRLVWAMELLKKQEAVAALIESAEELRMDLLSAADLALRHVAAGLYRISMIREGEGLADLVSDLSDLALLLTDFRAEFEAIKTDVNAESEKAAKMRDDLKNALAEEDVVKTLTGNKELRDRILTLTKRSLDDVRAYAGQAFRKDKTNTRRNLFTSTYQRRKNLKQRRKGNQVPVADSAVALS